MTFLAGLMQSVPGGYGRLPFQQGFPQPTAPPDQYSQCEYSPYSASPDMYPQGSPRQKLIPEHHPARNLSPSTTSNFYFICTLSFSNPTVICTHSFSVIYNRSMICVYYAKQSLIALRMEDAWAEFGAAVAVGFDCGRVVPSSTIHSGKQWSRAISHMLCSVTQAATICGTLLTCKSILFERHRHRPFKRPKAFSTTIQALLCR